MNILQCGYGSIGKVLFMEFSSMAQALGGTISVYDPYVKDCPNRINNLKKHYDVAFICVPTNKKENGSADTSVVIDVCNQINAEIIVIKSTIPKNIIDILPKNAIFSPEFTGTTQHTGKHNYVILGGERKLCNCIAELYKTIYDASFELIFTDIKTAIIAKYAENCFLALKVTFCNEIAQACKAEGVEYEDVRNIFIKDSRINPSHTFVYENHPYYDSHCLNKDIPAFISQFGLPLMKSVEKINNEMKKKYLNRS
ncbi:hypothetical protein [Treponema pedis]|uniref:hypothetical protein n=1 Tax=Treponema pedis TaxID=409322 RepID=UPI0004247938|nr:hypothetical protein [Treponema pedis]